MNLLLDIGNTHTHLGLAGPSKVSRQMNIATRLWAAGEARAEIARFVGKARIARAAFCSVVPKASRHARKALAEDWGIPVVELTHETIRGVGIDYPDPHKIGPDRLANAVAVAHHFGAPSLVVDFGTAVTFDVVDARRKYVGGIIAPGLAAMTDYLHEKTALLPKIEIREVAAVIGKNTEQAMLIGAVHGYRGLVRELIGELKRELGSERLPVVATGGYAKLISAKMPEITAVEPLLTLEGLRLVLAAHEAETRVVPKIGAARKQTRAKAE